MNHYDIDMTRAHFKILDNVYHKRHTHDDGFGHRPAKAGPRNRLVAELIRFGYMVRPEELTAKGLKALCDQNPDDATMAARHKTREEKEHDEAVKADKALKAEYARQMKVKHEEGLLRRAMFEALGVDTKEYSASELKILAHRLYVGELPK